jgi:glycosyltransferase involved in cell wall biosynthesis
VNLSVIVLTYNSEPIIERTLRGALLVSSEVHVVDSHSTDRTVEIAAALGALVVQHPFESYGDQRNWAIANLDLGGDWELHLDADEEVTPAFATALRKLLDRLPSSVCGVYVPRLTHFLGRSLRHGGIYPIWHLRIFRRGLGRCEHRRYDQHFMVNGPSVRLHEPLIDHVSASLSDWTARHNRWSDAEVEELLVPANRGGVRPSLAAPGPARRRALRRLYEAAPPFVRGFTLFLYRYVVRLGFLDGREGLIYHVLQAFWFRFLVDAKYYERTRKTGEQPTEHR